LASISDIVKVARDGGEQVMMRVSVSDEANQCTRTLLDIFQMTLFYDWIAVSFRYDVYCYAKRLIL